MSVIKVENLTFSYPGSYDNIFENVDFQIDTDWKLGFVGRNGRGKTTFLNLLMGKYEYQGKITSSVSFDYFPYDVKDKSRYTYEVLADICPDAENWQICKELSCLNIDDEVLWRSFETLSNGEQTKVLLAALFLKQCNFLLIDEPTNHLDREARALISSYLKNKKGFILISHDRYFLDGCVDHILSINRNTIEVRHCNFSEWLNDFRLREEYERSQSEHLKKDISRLKAAAQRASDWSDKVESSKIGAHSFDRGYVGHKASKMMKRSKSIEVRRQKAIDEKSTLLKNVELEGTLSLSPLSYRSLRLIEFDDVSVFYGDRQICGPVKFTVEKGERVLLAGANGSGKSSILKLILGFDISHSGTVSTGSGLIISYVAQDTSHLKGNLSDYAKERNIDESLFKTILRKMGFERVQFEKDMADFSGGQKKKVLIAASLCNKAHLYIWDEPLNFLDVHSRIQIEELILEYEPTMFFVEHDGAFQERIATKTVRI